MNKHKTTGPVNWEHFSPHRRGMGKNEAKRQRIIYNLIRLVVFNAVLLPVYFVGQLHTGRNLVNMGDRIDYTWPVYVISAISLGVLFALSTQWNLLDYSEKQERESERAAEEAFESGLGSK